MTIQEEKGSITIHVQLYWRDRESLLPFHNDIRLMSRQALLESCRECPGQSCVAANPLDRFEEVSEVVYDDARSNPSFTTESHKQSYRRKSITLSMLTVLES